MRSHLIWFSVLCSLFACNKGKTDHAIASTDSLSYQKTTITFPDSILSDACAISPLEFTNLYPLLDSIADDAFETLVLAKQLKSNGFTQIDWGRGNWEKGPRIISMVLTNDMCDCRIDKLYYNTDTEGTWKVTERIACSAATRNDKHQAENQNVK